MQKIATFPTETQATQFIHDLEGTVEGLAIEAYSGGACFVVRAPEGDSPATRVAKALGQERHDHRRLGEDFVRLTERYNQQVGAHSELADNYIRLEKRLEANGLPSSAHGDD